MWLVEGLDIVRRRRSILLLVTVALVGVGVVVSALLPEVLPPRWTVGAAVGLAAVLLGFALVVALDSTDPIVRGPRHVGAAGGELVAVLPTEPEQQAAARLAASVRDARPSGLLRLGVAAGGRNVVWTAAWADELAVALARDGLAVLYVDLASGWSAPPGLDEVVRDGVKLGEAVTFESGVELARLGAGANQASALASLGVLVDRLPRDLDVLVVALPTAASQKVVGAANSLDHILMVGERDRTARIDLIAGGEALRTVGHQPQVILLDDVTAALSGATSTDDAAQEPESASAPEAAASPEPELDTQVMASDTQVVGPEPEPAEPEPAEPEPVEPDPAATPSEPWPPPEQQQPSSADDADDEQMASDARDVEVLLHAHEATAAALLEHDAAEGLDEPTRGTSRVDGSDAGADAPVSDAPDADADAPDAEVAWDEVTAAQPADAPLTDAPPAESGDALPRPVIDPEVELPVDPQAAPQADPDPQPQLRFDPHPQPDPQPQSQPRDPDGTDELPRIVRSDPPPDTPPATPHLVPPHDPAASAPSKEEMLQAMAALSVLDRELGQREERPSGHEARQAQRRSDTDARPAPTADDAHDPHASDRADTGERGHDGDADDAHDRDTGL